MALRDIPRTPRALATLAGYVRERLADVSDALLPADRLRLADGPRAAASTEIAMATLARQFAVAVVGAAAPFAPTAYGRARLLRQMRASGLLTDDEVRRTATLIDSADVFEGGELRHDGGPVVIDLDALDRPAD